MTTFTDINTTISQQFTSITTGHHATCVSSVIPTTTTSSASNVTQLPQGVLIYELSTHVHIYVW